MYIRLSLAEVFRVGVTVQKLKETKQRKHFFTRVQYWSGVFFFFLYQPLLYQTSSSVGEHANKPARLALNLFFLSL